MLITILIIFFGLVGCDRKTPANMKTITIDGCEYIQFHQAYNHPAIIHKGNCNNPIHQTQLNTK